MALLDPNPTAPTSNPADLGDSTILQGPHGDLQTVSNDEVPKALLSQDQGGGGYSQADPSAIQAVKQQAQYQTRPQEALGALEQAGSAATLHALPVLETGLGLTTPQAIAGRQQALGPLGNFVSQGAGLVGGALAAPELGAAKLLGMAGEAGASALGLAAPASALAKVGSAAVKGFIENAVYQGTDEVSKLAMGDPNSIETAAANIGLAGLIGTPFGMAIGAVSPLWEAASGSSVGQILKNIVDRGEGKDISFAEHPVTKFSSHVAQSGVQNLTTDPNDSVKDTDISPTSFLDGFHNTNDILNPGGKGLGTAARQGPLGGEISDLSEPIKGLPISSSGPNPNIQSLARDYSNAVGIEFKRQPEYVKVDPQNGARIADAYEAMQNNPNDPQVQASYRALIDETLAQFQLVKKSGLKIEAIQSGQANPYPNGSADFLKDIRGGHLWFFPTDQGFGMGAVGSDHPLLEPTNESIDGRPLLANDVFRIVHDIFGHAKEGVGIGPTGEENAWISHMNMYSPLAQKAMTTETRGQNSWVNFGPHGEANRANPQNTIYADQKAGILPDWVWNKNTSTLKRPGPNLSQINTENAMEASGMKLDPVMKSAISQDPEIQQMFQTLQESPSKSGLEAQQIFNNFKSQANDLLVKSLGKTPEDLDGLSELSQYDSGKLAQDSLAKQLSQEYQPIKNIFDMVQNKFKAVPFTRADGDTIQTKIGQLIQNKGYDLSPSAPAAKIIQTTLDELSNIKDLDGLRKYTSLINEKTQDPTLWKVGSDLRNIFRGTESDIVSRELSDKAPELFDQHALGRASYGEMMNTIDSLNDRLHVGKYYGPESFISSLKEMAPEDVLRRLSGKNDADLLNMMSERFPETAANIKDYHVNSILKNASDRAAPGQSISPKILFNSLDKMSPELRKFAFPETTTASLSNQFNSVRALLEAVPQKMNTSGTAKTLTAVWKHMPGTAVGMASMLLGHNPVMSAMIGYLAEHVGVNLPDAIRLSTLKMLGENKPVNSGAFKTAADTIAHVMRGENKINKSVKNVFKAAQVAAPSLRPQKFAGGGEVEPNPSTSKLDDLLQKYQEDPKQMLNMGGSLGHYMPEHSSALAATGANAIQYLNSKRPLTMKNAPLDSETVIPKMAEDKFQRSLQIAQEPTKVLDHIKAGTLHADDVTDLGTLYPALHQRIISKLTEEMTNHLSKGNDIPYKTRMGLSMLMAQPLDSTMTPQGIMSNQTTFLMNASPTQSAPKARGGGAHAMRALSKASEIDQTPLQNRETARQSN